ncbi:MAG: amidohydrolase family protein [Pseudomonadota bacterium]
MEFDLKITGGLIYDGNGGEPFQGDVAIRNGVIVAIGDCPGSAKELLDAQGHIVTPGFIDLHTHYDGQISWDANLQPSINHGVSTVVMGSCGVGFAPVRPGDRNKLIRLMEGVEDIPGIALRGNHLGVGNTPRVYECPRCKAPLDRLRRSGNS